MRITTVAVLALSLAVAGGAFAQSSGPKYRLELIDTFASNVYVSQLYVNESGLVGAFGSNTTVGKQSIRWSGPGQFVTTPTSLGLTPLWLSNTGRFAGVSNPPAGGIVSVALDGSATQINPPQQVGSYRTVAAVAPNDAYTGTDDFGVQHGYRVGTGAGDQYVSANGGFERLTGVIGMNDSGVVAGTYLDPSGGPGPNRAWVARDGVARVLPEVVNGLAGLTMARDLDSRGRVLGTSTRNGVDRTVIWGEDDAPSLVVPPTGFAITQTIRFNASSTVLAYYSSTTGLQPGYFGISTPAGTYRWQDLIEGGTAGLEIQGFSDISDSGYIVGNVAVNGVNRAFRMVPLNPVPEPGALAALGLGAAALLRRRRR